MGNVSGMYVRNNAIHQTFNRAVTIHGNIFYSLYETYVTRNSKNSLEKETFILNFSSIKAFDSFDFLTRFKFHFVVFDVCLPEL